MTKQKLLLYGAILNAKYDGLYIMTKQKLLLYGAILNAKYDGHYELVTEITNLSLKITNFISMNIYIVMLFVLTYIFRLP